MINNRYDKSIMEPFAITTVSMSFDSSYSYFISPKNNDNFDFISPDNLHALEVVTVFSENEKNAYEYEKQHLKGKTNLNKEKIKHAIFKEDGSISSYYGGSLSEIIRIINKFIEEKNKKAKIRKNKHHYESVDLCVCIDDGGLMDLYSFQLADLNLNNSEFNNIFFITSSYFFRYSKVTGFEQYNRIIDCS